MDIQFTKDELVRICKGTRAIQTPITTEELRAATASMGPEAAALAAEKPDQWFREVLSKAEETCQNPSSLAGHLLMDELDRRKPDLHRDIFTAVIDLHRVCGFRPQRDYHMAGKRKQCGDKRVLYPPGFVPCSV